MLLLLMSACLFREGTVTVEGVSVEVVLDAGGLEGGLLSGASDLVNAPAWPATTSLFLDSCARGIDHVEVEAASISSTEGALDGVFDGEIGLDLQDLDLAGTPPPAAMDLSLEVPAGATPDLLGAVESGEEIGRASCRERV